MPCVHFKMETIQSVLLLITLDCYLTSTGLKDAYLSLETLSNFRKYLKFIWKEQL